MNLRFQPANIWFTSVASAVVLVCAACMQEPVAPLDEPGPGEDTSATIHRATAVEILGTRTVRVGDSATLEAEAKDSAGLTLAAAKTYWSSSDSTLIKVDSQGVVRPLRIGTVVITALTDSVVDTVHVTSFLPPYTFVFADTASAVEKQLIRDGIQNAHAFHLSTLGRVIEDSTVVSGLFSAPGCSNGGAAAYTGAGTVVFCLGNPGWKNNGPVRKEKIVQHELFHVWQFEVGWITNPATAGATWLIEGAAEWMGYRGVAARGLVSFETALGCQVKEAADFAVRTPPGLPALSTVESRMAFQSTMGPLYTHSMLAANYLIGTGSPVVLKTYADQIALGVGWQTSFGSAFGKSPAMFYGEFPGYLSSLAVPPQYLCGL